MSTPSFSIKRKIYTSLVHCSNPKFSRHIGRCACHVRGASFKSYKFCRVEPLYQLVHRILSANAEKHPHRGEIEQKLGRHQNGTNLNSSSRAITFSKRTHELDTVGANVSPKSIPSRCLKPRPTSLDLAFTIHPCSSVFHVYTHFASITFSNGCYTGAKVPACSKPWNNLFIDCRHIPHAVAPPPQKH